LILENFGRVFDKNSVVFSFNLRNDGNIQLNPKGVMTVKDSFVGISLEKFDFDLRMVMPGKPTQVPVIWKPKLPLGKFTASTQITYGDRPDEQIIKEISFWYIPVKTKLVLGGVAVLFILYFVKSLFSRKKKK
jgi:hypothetical protein